MCSVNLFTIHTLPELNGQPISTILSTTPSLYILITNTAIFLDWNELLHESDRKQHSTSIQNSNQSW